MLKCSLCHKFYWWTKDKPIHCEPKYEARCEAGVSCKTHRIKNEKYET